MNILHLTHTDINSDSRILKEMGCLFNCFDGSRIIGIGVQLDEELHKTKSKNSFEIFSVQLISRKWRKLPAVIRHTLCLLELTFKMVISAVKVKPAIIHCHDTTVLPLGVIVKLFTGARLIYDAHELESDRNGLTKILQKLTLWAEKILWRFVDALIVVSPSIEAWYQSTIGKKYSTVIMNSPYLEVNANCYDKEYLRNKYQIPQESSIFMYVGILGKGRGIEFILEAFTQKDIKSHLVFLGYGEMETDIRELSKINMNIHLHDAVPHSEVVPIVKSADFGLCFIQNVSLSDYYCLPNKLFEYAFAGVPVLASNFPDIEIIVQKYHLGKCCNLDRESIYQAIKHANLFKKSTDLERLYPLSWSAQEDKLIAMYKELIK